MTYQKVCAALAAAGFLIGLVLVVIGGHGKAVEECLYGGLVLLAAAHT